MNLNTDLISRETKLPTEVVDFIIAEFSKGHPVPYLVKFHKHELQNAREHKIYHVIKIWQNLNKLSAEKNRLIESLTQKNKISPELKIKINHAKTLEQLKDLAMIFDVTSPKVENAIANGLKAFADQIWKQEEITEPLEALAQNFINAEKNITSLDQVLKGMRVILEEKVTQSVYIRDLLHHFFMTEGFLQTQKAAHIKELKKEFTKLAPAQYKLNNIQPSLYLEILKAKNKKIITTEIVIDDEKAIAKIYEKTIRSQNPVIEFQLKSTISQVYHEVLKKSVFQSLERNLFEKSKQLILDHCTEKLEQLLKQPTLLHKTLLAIDPEKTHCNLIVLSKNNELLFTHSFLTQHLVSTDSTHTETAKAELTAPLEENSSKEINPNNHEAETTESTTIETSPAEQAVSKQLPTQVLSPAELKKIIEEHQPEIIVVHKNKYFHSTIKFLKETLQNLNRPLATLGVQALGMDFEQSGKKLSNQFPDQTKETLTTIALAKRIQDPLTELLKFPLHRLYLVAQQNILSETELQNELKDLVEPLVNALGLDLNTASIGVLQYVAGLNLTLAQAIHHHRLQQPFTSRQELKNVVGIDDTVFELCSSFLKVHGTNPLDQTFIHPKHYDVVEKMAAKLSTSVDKLLEDKSLLDQLVIDDLTSENISKHDISNIIQEIKYPTPSPRKNIDFIKSQLNIKEISDLKKGDILQARVSKFMDYGVFVDFGVEKEGFIHKSAMAKETVKDPSRYLRLGQTVTVQVKEVDVENKKMELTMLIERPVPEKKPVPQKTFHERQPLAENRKTFNKDRQKQKPFQQKHVDKKPQKIFGTLADKFNFSGK